MGGGGSIPEPREDQNVDDVVLRDDVRLKHQVRAVPGRVGTRQNTFSKYSIVINAILFCGAICFLIARGLANHAGVVSVSTHNVCSDPKFSKRFSGSVVRSLPPRSLDCAITDLRVDIAIWGLRYGRQGLDYAFHSRRWASIPMKALLSQRPANAQLISTQHGQVRHSGECMPPKPSILVPVVATQSSNRETKSVRTTQTVLRHAPEKQIIVTNVTFSCGAICFLISRGRTNHAGVVRMALTTFAATPCSRRGLARAW